MAQIFSAVATRSKFRTFVWTAVGRAPRRSHCRRGSRFRVGHVERLDLEVDRWSLHRDRSDGDGLTALVDAVGHGLQLAIVFGYLHHGAQAFSGLEGSLPVAGDVFVLRETS